MREHCAVVVDVAVAVAVPHDGVLVPHGGCAAARTGGPAVVRAVDTGVGRLLADIFPVCKRNFKKKIIIIILFIKMRHLSFVWVVEILRDRCVGLR